MITIATYDLTTVFNAMEPVPTKGILPDGQKFRPASERLVLFKTKGTQCVKCGLNGSEFILETHNQNIRPHLNLYGYNTRGKKILFTKDHIIPKSKGGRNRLDNYNPMCQPCNNKKADTLTA